MRSVILIVVIDLYQLLEYPYQGVSIHWMDYWTDIFLFLHIF